MTDRTKATTHAADCWSWGPAHYDCAVREIERLAEALREIDAANDARHDSEHPVDAIIMLAASAIAGVEIGNWLAPDIAAWIAGLPPVTFSCFGC